MQDVPNPNPSIGTSPSTDPASFAFSLDELASENFDVIQWINTSLQCISSANPDGVETDAELEGRITNLYGRLHSYSQEVASSVDDTITQALVRLPRTGLEVGRMVTEVQQLQQALCKIREEAQPAVEMISKPYVAQLNDLKKTQKKLMRCSETLKKASEVDSNMKQLDDIMEKLRVSVSEVDIDLVAVSIREVRQNLADLQKLEVTFGGKQLEAVERHEQLLQRVVETECMEQLRRRVVDRAAHLLKVLDTIGRADAVLQQFSAESIASEKEKVFCLLHHSESKVSRHPISPVRAAEVLKTQLIPSLGCALTDQLDYLMQLAHVYSGNRDITDNAEISEGPESQPVKVLRLMADEIVECLSTCLTPILQCVERNPELISCFEAVRQLSIKIDSTPPKVCVGAEDGRNVKNSLCRRDDIAEQINFYTQTELAHIFEQPKVLESFARREAERVEDLLKDSQSIMKYDRFQVVMNGLMEAVKAVLQFFPDKTLPICVSRWKVALVQSLTFFQPAPHTHQTELLERLSALRKIVQQLLLSTQKMCEDYVKSAEVRRLRPTEVESINSQLSEQLWRPLNNVLVICAAECQQAIKQTVIAPVIATADGYESQPLWRLQSSNGGSAVISNSVLHTPLHLAPSEMVRGFGEAIVEIPLALESLRGGSEGRFDGIEELLEEVTEYWLDDIVRTAVSDFIESKVANIIMCFPLNSDDAAALAVEQLVTDLSYLKSILAAVSDDPFERLESVLSRLKTASIKSGSTIAIRELIAEQGQSKE